MDPGAWAAIFVPSGASIVCAFILSRGQRTTHEKVDTVLGEVQTGNGHTLGELTEQVAEKITNGD